MMQGKGMMPGMGGKGSGMPMGGMPGMMPMGGMPGMMPQKGGMPMPGMPGHPQQMMMMQQQMMMMQGKGGMMPMKGMPMQGKGMPQMQGMAPMQGKGQPQMQQPAPGPNAPLTAAALAAASPGMQKQMLGEKLYPLVAKKQPELAGKIVGMMLEMDNSELLMQLESEQMLNAKINEAMTVLQSK